MASANDNRVIIFDTTLRDGEQSPGASMTLDEKLRVAQALAELKVDVIEAGFAIASNGDFQSVNEIAKQISGPTICSLARRHGDIERPPKHWNRLRTNAFTPLSPPARCT